MKTLVAGWFSMDHGGATAGDLLACEVVCDWLEQAGCSYDILVAPPFSGGMCRSSVDPGQYSQVLFVCGPFRNFTLERRFLRQFAGKRIVGVNVSMPAPLGEWNPFSVLLERDSARVTRPDLAFLSAHHPVPVVGVCLGEPDVETLDTVANDAVQRLVGSREMSVVMIDTRLDANITGLRTAAEVESLVARTDLLVTTRLHGLVLALKHGVPAIAIDSNPQGRKVLRQATAIGWPLVFPVPDLDDADLARALAYCLSDKGRAKAIECRDRALGLLQGLRGEFAAEMAPFSSAASAPATGNQRTAARPRIVAAQRPRLYLATYPHAYHVPAPPPNDVGLLRTILRKALPRAIGGRLEELLTGR